MAEDTGPIIYENWRAYRAGKTMTAGWEFPLYTDAHILGDGPEHLGPYQLYNTCAFRARNAPRIILKFQYHLDANVAPDMATTNTENYFVGNYGSQLASLVGLCMGIRLRAADITRTFGSGPGGDQLGRPAYLGENYLVDLPVFTRRPRLPRCLTERNLNQEVVLLGSLAELPATMVSTLLKCAYLYQDALWHAESDPNSSWISMVSAVETAANYWRKEKEPVMERFTISHPDLLNLLREKGDEAWVTSIASYLDKYMGATKKFADFLLKFLPPPMSPRTDVRHQVAWDAESLRKAFTIIYGWRSKALHGGIAFPNPMLDPPWSHGEIVAEVPFGLASAAHGGQWLIKDTPMLLHTFEHIVRRSLLNWWGSEQPEQQKSGKLAAS